MITTLLVAAYIIGSELCIPAARHALRTGEAQVWINAASLVALGEWALIASGATFLLIAQDLWQLFTGTLAGRIAGFGAAGLVAGAAIRELAGRMRKNRAVVMSHTLDLVLPAQGARRELYERTRQRLESGSRIEQLRIVRQLLE